MHKKCGQNLFTLNNPTKRGVCDRNMNFVLRKNSKKIAKKLLTKEPFGCIMNRVQARTSYGCV